MVKKIKYNNKYYIRKPELIPSTCQGCIFYHLDTSIVCERFTRQNLDAIGYSGCNNIVWILLPLKDTLKKL